jgi:predicted transcriptional regulator
VLLAADDADESQRGIATWLGVTKTAVAKLIDGSRDLYRSDAVFRDRIERIRAQAKRQGARF